jgi:hypothetical protein
LSSGDFADDGQDEAVGPERPGRDLFFVQGLQALAGRGEDAGGGDRRQLAAAGEDVGQRLALVELADQVMPAVRLAEVERQADKGIAHGHGPLGSGLESP